MNIQKEFKKRLEKKLNELYPKGKRLNVVEFREGKLPLIKEYSPRDEALVFNACANIILKDLLKKYE